MIRLRSSERKVLLVVMDLFFLSLALTISLLLRTNLLPGAYALLLNIKWYITLWLVWAVIATVFDVYNLHRSAETNRIIWNTVGASGISSLIYLATPWLTPPIENRTQAFLFVGLSITLVGIWRIVHAGLFMRSAFQVRTLVVGAGLSGQSLLRALRSQEVGGELNPFLGTGHELIGFVDDDPERLDEFIEGVPVLGNSSLLVELVRQLDIDEVVIAITHLQTICPELFEAMLDCREMGIPVVTMTTIHERLTGRVAFEHASQNVELVSGQAESPFARMFDFIKRIIDIIGSLVGLAALILVIPFVLVANILWSPGPLFFRQRRVGKGGRHIEVIKLRSMVPNAEQESGAVWASEHDGRVTAVGRWLRNSHLDELPQFINVLKGEMSVVGPRPERPEFVDELSKSIPFYRARHSVKPGITGWAQIHQDYGDSIEGAKEKLGYDLYYIKRVGPFIDTLIVLRTISKVFGLRGR